MREIKFRAWDSYNKEMLKMNHAGHFIGTGSYSLAMVLNYEKGVIPLQFTGLIDNSGKDIYDGDILAPFGNITQAPQIENCFVVEYSNGSYNIGKESDTDYCIIGNVYETPELINP